MAKDTERSIAAYILKYYSGSVIEVGAGYRRTVAEHLNRSGIDILTTDILDEEKIPDAVNYIRDDITDPDLEIYRGASLIYSIRPPEELQIPIARVASLVGADLILKPLGCEIVDLSRYFKVCEVVNYRDAVFMLYRFFSVS